MERFSSEFRSVFSTAELLDNIEKSGTKLDSMKRARFDVPTLVPEFYEQGSMPRLPIKLMLLMQNAIRRGLELSDSMIRDTNASATHRCSPAHEACSSWHL